MAYILSVSGLKIRVSERDFNYLNQFTWQIVNAPYTKYARTNITGKKNDKRVYMHKMILPGCPMVDHKDGDGLNNLRTNLRPCDRSQNGKNRRGDLKGILQVSKNSWRVIFNRKYVGSFKTPHLAKKAYNKEVVKSKDSFFRKNKI